MARMSYNPLERDEIGGLSDEERRSYHAFRRHGHGHDEALQSARDSVAARHNGPAVATRPSSAQETSDAILTALRNAWRERTALAETAEAHEAVQFAANAASAVYPGQTSGWYATALNVHTVEERRRLNLPGGVS